MGRLKMLQGQALLPYAFSYDVGRTTEQECEFRTVRLFRPYSLEEEQAVADYDRGKSLYYWVAENNFQEIFNAQYTNQYSDWRAYSFDSPDLPIQPPTEQEYLAGGKYYVKKAQFRAYYTIDSATDGSLRPIYSDPIDAQWWVTPAKGPV